MRPHLSISRYLRNIALCSIPSLLSISSSWAGIMDCKNYTVNDYRNFAENRGKFNTSATNIPIYDLSGKQTGTISRVMNFDSAIDVWRNNEDNTRSGEASLVGGPNFLAGVAHDYEQTSVSFVHRFGGAPGTVYDDNYRIINAINGDADLTPGSASSYRDFRVSRLSKIVTEATATDYYVGDISRLNGQTLQRVGGGEPIAVTASGSDKIDLEYIWLSGGLVKVTTATTLPAKPGNGPAWEYEATRISTGSINGSKTTPMVNQAAGGDSGSGAWWYDEEAGQWFFVGALTAGSTSQDGYATGQFLGANKWAVSVIDGYNTNVETKSNGTILWEQGKISSGSELSKSKLSMNGQEIASFTTLAEGYMGDTSTSGLWQAANESINACNNLILSGTGNNTLQVKGTMDTGAGYIQFTTNFTVTPSDSSTRLNTAGWVIDKNVTVKTELTGDYEDEWRMIGDGDVHINGTGNNRANLNVGGNLLVHLNRTGGYAIENLKINAGNAIVRITGAGDQIGGSIIFGHRGGVLDLYGHDWTAAHAFVGSENALDLIGEKYIAVMDSGARIANLKENSSSTFSYTATGATKYIGSFLDDGARGAVLNIEYTGGSNGEWTLSGVNQTSGTWKINSGNIIIAGTLQDYYGNVDDYNTAVLKAGTVVIAENSSLTAGSHSQIEANIASSGTLHLKGESALKGNIFLAGNGKIDAAISNGESALEGVIDGWGGIKKSGSGTLVLTNSSNTFTGAGIIEAGVLKAHSAGALGETTWNVQQAGTIYVDVAQWDAYKSKISSASQGAIGLSGQISDVSSVNMNGLSSMSLGAIGSASLGDEGTTQTLQGWTSDGGYSFSGTTGELTVHAKLNGNGMMTIGGSDKNGIVVLSGDNSLYTGVITVNSGSGLIMNGTNMIGQISSSSYGTLLVRGNAHDHYDFTGKSNLRFGTDSTADYSGQFKGGNYIFGGTGTLRLSSAISGNATIESGTHIWVNSNNSITGTINIADRAILQIGDGATGGSIGSGNLNIASGGKLVLNSDANMLIGTRISGQGFIEKRGTGTSILTNSCEVLKLTVSNGSIQLGDGKTTGNIGRNTQIDLNDGTSLIINRSDDIALSGYINQVSGSAKLIKQGSGKLTIEHWKNNYTGGTFVQQGTLAFGSEAAAGTKVVTLEGGCFDMRNMALSNAVNVTKAGSSLQNVANYAGTLTVNADMGMSGKLGNGAASIIIGNGNTMTWNNSLDWFQTNTLAISSISNNGTLQFDFSGTSATLNSEKSWTLMTSSQGAFGRYDWVKNSVSLAKGYAAGLSDVNGVLSFVVTKSSVIDQNGNVIGNYTPGVGDITDVNNVNKDVTFSVQNGVSAGITGNVEGSLVVGTGGTVSLADSALNGYVSINGGSIHADSSKNVSIGTQGSFFIQDGEGIDMVNVSASGQAATISNGFKVETTSDSSASMAGSYDHTKIEFQKGDSSIIVAKGDSFQVSKNSRVVNASGITNTSIQVHGVMNNNSSTAISSNVAVKSGGLLCGAGIYAGTVSIEGGATFKIGNSPGVSSVNNLNFSGGTGNGTLDFAVNGDVVASTGGWADNGHSQLVISGQFTIENAINFNIEVGKEYFNNIILTQGDGVTGDYVFLLFNNSATLNLGGTTYALFNAEQIQSWFDDHSSWSFKSSDSMAISDGTDISFEKLVYNYNATTGTASLSTTLKYGTGAAVPEPSSALLLLIGATSLLARRKRRTPAKSNQTAIV